MVLNELIDPENEFDEVDAKEFFEHLKGLR